MFKTSMFRKIIIASISIQTLLLACFLLFYQYFQQDEWHGFGIMLSQGIRYVTLDKSIPELLLGDRVGARVLAFGLFNIFHLNPIPYGIFALTMQTLNTLLVFLLAKKLTKQTNIALLASLFFTTNELGNEAYSWFGTMTGSLTSVFFFLLSLIIFLKFIDTKKIRDVLFSTFLLWLSFLFKEVGAFAFIFYPILFLIYSAERKKILTLPKRLLPFMILGGIMLIFFAKTVLFIPGDRANYVNTGKSLIPSLLTHAIRYSLEGTMQTIIPNTYLFELSNITTKIIRFDLPSDSLDFLVATENSGAEVTLITLSIIVIIIFLIFRKKIKDMSTYSRKALLASIVMTALSFLPYIVINRSSSYLDSRYYYLGTVGISIFLATLFSNLVQISKQKMRFIVILIAIFYIFMHESILLSDAKLLMQRSAERQMFIKQVENLLPVLANKTIFFITGNYDGYYGIPELKTPFQSGLGQVLMIVYATKGQISLAFFNEATLIKLYDFGFLYDILGQGYREVNGKGFGYYYDINKLKEALDKKLFSRDNVISLYYKYENKELIRKKLEL